MNPLKTPDAQQARPGWRRRLFRLCSTLGLAVALTLTLFSAVSSAAFLHPVQTDSFGPDGTDTAAGFGGTTVAGLAFDSTLHRLYVLRPYLYNPGCGECPPPPQEPRGVFAFDVSVPGVNTRLGGDFPIPLFQPNFDPLIAVDETEGNVYYLDANGGSNRQTGTIYGYDSTGAPLGGNFPVSLTHRVTDVAVDPLGYLWTAQDTFGIDGEGHTIEVEQTMKKYSPEGVLLEAVNMDPFGPRLIAFDKDTGDLWAWGGSKDRVGAEMVRWSAASGYTEAVARFKLERPNAIAVDSAHDVVYTLFESHVEARNEDGVVLESFATGGKYRGMAFDDSTGTIYLDDISENGDTVLEPGSKIRVWRGVVAPDVETGQPSSIGHTGATLTGSVAPAGGPGVSECRIEYEAAKNFNEIQKVTLPESYAGTFTLFFLGYPGEPTPLAANSTATQVQAALEALSLVGPGNVEVTGPAGGPYLIEFLTGEDLIPLYAEISSPGASGNVPTVRQGGLAGDGWAAPSSLPCEPPASSGTPFTGPTSVQVEPQGLESGTFFYYRVVAANAHGETTGVSRSFAPQPSLTKTGDVSDLDRHSATLNGTVDPEGLATTYYFQYGHSASYGGTSSAEPGADVGTTASGDQPVSAGIGGLAPGSTYHYRLVAVNSKGTSYGADRTFPAKASVLLSTDAPTEVARVTATLNGTVDPDGHQTNYYFEWGRTKRYGATSAVPPGPDVGTSEAGDLALSTEADGLKTETTYHFRIVGTNSFGTTYGQDRTFTTLPAVFGIHTLPASDVVPTAAVLNGELDPDGVPTTYYFQWGKSALYGHNLPLPPGEDVDVVEPGSVSLSSLLNDLEPGTSYHFRLVGVNHFGITAGEDRSFSTPQSPSIDGVFSSDVTASSAVLRARINPNDYETSYSFQYGITTQYGNVAPVPAGSLPAVHAGQNVSVAIGGLQGVTYHFRLVTQNKWGTTTSGDQTFEFNPPVCPNAAVRQQTGAAYLPDCRAYELVSPARAGGAALSAEGPTSPLVGDRFAFSGAINAIPGSGNPPNAGFPFPLSDLYVASRRVDGWVTRYVGLSAEETVSQAGVPAGRVRGPAGVPADLTLSRFLTWNNSEAGRSYAPYLWDSDGNALGRWPTNVNEVAGATDTGLGNGFAGDARPSADFSHYVFSSRNLAFADGGRTSAPGSVYDDDIAAGVVRIASLTAGGGNIPQDPGAGGGSAEFVRIPAVSRDGSHILMSTFASGGGTHLYMRVGGAVSYDVSFGEDLKDHGVDFAGMTDDGAAVYFTTGAQMTTDDHDSSVDLYRWTENAAPHLLRLSQGSEGAGNSDACNPTWAIKCGVEVVPTDTRLRAGSNESLQPIDSSLASQAGDVYFYSPEELEGARGTPGKRNLYVWRNGSVQHVATLNALAGASQINVSPDGSHMAFVTSTRIGSYDNAGHSEMFVYEAPSRIIRCVSCRADGAVPTANVAGAQNGIFMADDGRAFFSTADALVNRDANGITDVYEYVGGRPQLISTGTGNDAGSAERPIGLVGVSADGINVFISTFETLVGQDENGAFLKFYDARTNGGFPFKGPAPACAAADECHGPGSPTPGSPQSGSSASLGDNGNRAPSKHVRKKKKKRRKATQKSKRGRHSKRHHRHRSKVGRRAGRTAGTGSGR